MTSEPVVEEEISCKFGKFMMDLTKRFKETDLKEFSLLKHDSDRVRFLLNHPLLEGLLDIVPDYLEKNAEKSNQYRAEGNKLFQKKRFKEALQKFNESVCTAPFSRSTQRDPSEEGHQSATENGSTEENESGTLGNQDVPLDEPKGLGSDELALGLANRSAALQFLRKYDLAITDIDLAIRYGYPTDVQYKLLDRKGKCYIHLGKKSEAIECFKCGLKFLETIKIDEVGKQLWTLNFQKQMKHAETITEGKVNKKVKVGTNTELPPLSVGKSSKFECTSKAFEVDYDDECGRFVKVTEDINIGDVIGVEKPYTSVLFSTHYATYCYHCSVIMHAPIPCHQCSNVGFCSEACQQAAWSEYHYTECNFMGWLSELWVAKMGQLAFRVTVVTGIEKLRQFFGGEDDLTKVKPSAISGFSKDGIYRNDYNAIFNLVTNHQYRLTDGVFHFTIMAVLLLKVLKQSDHFWSGTTPEDEVLVGASLVHHLYIVQCNAMNITSMKLNKDFRLCQPEDIGLALYPTAALMNHSCDPNIDLIFWGNVNVYHATSNIKAGASIFIDYGMAFYTHPKEEREFILESQFFFSCKCRACVNKWPLWEEVECKSPTFLCESCGEGLPQAKSLVINCPKCGHAQNIGQMLHQLQVSHELYSLAMKDVLEDKIDAALPVLEEHLSLMQRFIQSPWRDYISCHATIKQCYSILGNCSKPL